ncbi:hypothetical protein [Alphaproteobacteria bacterium endosymbiont of Tiliacea citrago]|uniref:hypothetical protein n=1 Tax=Alphaproteobacteria bacterium endosymbiont of Tiliacea citrago TaxID=3077944 RepID=UPI00313D3DC0
MQNVRFFIFLQLFLQLFLKADITLREILGREEEYVREVSPGGDISRINDYKIEDWLKILLAARYYYVDKEINDYNNKADLQNKLSKPILITNCEYEDQIKEYIPDYNLSNFCIFIVKNDSNQFKKSGNCSYKAVTSFESFVETSPINRLNKEPSEILKEFELIKWAKKSLFLKDCLKNSY